MISGDAVTAGGNDVRAEDSLTSTIERTTRELRAIAASVDELEHVVGAALTLAGSGAPSNSHILELQSLDVVRQKVAGVADFLDALNETIPQAWRVDAEAAARVITLSDMAARLAGVETEMDRANFAAPEAYDLFD